MEKHYQKKSLLKIFPTGSVAIFENVIHLQVQCRIAPHYFFINIIDLQANTPTVL